MATFQRGLATDLAAALGRVPNYSRFYTVAELFAQAYRVAEAHPELASCQVVGRSTDGESIPMVRLGHGEEHVLLFACPHPNEPIGAMLVSFLLDELISDAALREGRSWFLLPCVDPDGTRLNEGWFAGPFTVRHYARHFYRPRSAEQVEWTFPVDYKALHFHTPLPETEALMRAFELSKPQLVYSLHNAGFGGVYYYVSHDLGSAYEAFHQVPLERGLGLSLGEPEMPWAVTFAPAVYKMPSIMEAYDHLETYGDLPPADLIQGGASSYDFLKSQGEPVMLIAELPYFQSPQLSDQTPTSETRRDVILSGIDLSQTFVTTLRGLLDRIAPEMTLDTRFYRTVVSFVDQIGDGLESKRSWAQQAEGMDTQATVAQVADERYVGPFYRLLIASMLRRALLAQLEQTPSALLEGALGELGAELDRWAERIEAGLEYTATPIKKLIEVQYGALLAVLAATEYQTATQKA